MKEWLTIVTDNTTGIAGYLHIVDINNTDNFAVYTLNSHTQVTNDYGNVGVTFVRAYPLSYALTDNKKYRLQLVSGGSRGAQGHQGFTGYTGFQGYQGYQGYQGDIVNWWDTYESTYDINYSGSAPNNQTFGIIYSSSYVIDISGAGADAISDDIAFSAKEAEAMKFRLENLIIAGIVKEEIDTPATGYKTYTLLKNIHIIIQPDTYDWLWNNYIYLDNGCIFDGSGNSITVDQDGSSSNGLSGLFRVYHHQNQSNPTVEQYLSWSPDTSLRNEIKNLGIKWNSRWKFYEYSKIELSIFYRWRSRGWFYSFETAFWKLRKLGFCGYGCILVQ